MVVLGLDAVELVHVFPGGAVAVFDGGCEPDNAGMVQGRWVLGPTMLKTEWPGLKLDVVLPW